MKIVLYIPTQPPLQRGGVSKLSSKLDFLFGSLPLKEGLGMDVSKSKHEYLILN